MSQAGLKALVELLQSLFSADELRRFVALLPGENLASALPSGSPSLATLAFEAVDVLGRHGLLDRSLFELLEQERPARRDEIAGVRALLMASMASARPAALPSVPGHGRTTPRPFDPLAAKIEHALARKRRLDDAGQPTDDISAEIRELKREHRRGGQLRRGDALGERYLLIEQIGRGGFATVWSAQDRASGDDVAIKVLHPELAGDVVRRQRFFRGARIMAELAHPLIVRIRERQAEDDGFFYFVMELVTGGNLQDAVLARRLQRELAMPITLGIGDALAQAHARGHVHRDVKPVNILLTESGEPRLTDFDLVTGQDTTGGTRTGALGTFIYAAPEMMERPQDADARADVYGLGMTTAFMLHGDTLPRKALTARQRFIKELGCPPALAAVLKQATAEDPDERHPDAATFCEALRGAAARDSYRAGSRPLETVSVPATQAAPSITPESLVERERQLLTSGVPLPTEWNYVDFGDLASVVALSRRMHGAALETARTLEGVWMSSEKSLHCISLIADRMIVPYCWGGSSFLSSVWYDCVIEDGTLYCHFRWLRNNIGGHASLGIVSRDRLAGYWWGRDCEPGCRFPDGTRSSHETAVRFWLARLPGHGMPDWAAEYLRNGVRLRDPSRE